MDEKGEVTIEPPKANVLLVDDKAENLLALDAVLSDLNQNLVQATSAREALRHLLLEDFALILLDVQMPGLSGLDLQRELAQHGRPIPIVFTTGHGDIPMTVEAMKAGAIGFLSKPFRNQDMIDAIKEGIARDREARKKLDEVAELRTRYDSLTAREREVFALVARGLLNKQIALELGTSERTIKAHRAQVVQKMHADSVADLVRMADKLAV